MGTRCFGGLYSKARRFIPIKYKYLYSSLRPFMGFTTNRFAQKFNFLTNIIIYFVNICYIHMYILSEIIK